MEGQKVDGYDDVRLTGTHSSNLSSYGSEMSFDVFLSCYQNGEPSGVEETLVREAFGEALIGENIEFSSWHLEFGNEIQSCDVFITRLPADPARILSILVSRPVMETRLWESLYRIMQLGNVILFFPGGRSPLFAGEQAVQHFPQDMLEALGQPVIIKNGSEILAAIEQT